jgi:hypothetical protein
MVTKPGSPKNGDSKHWFVLYKHYATDALKVIHYLYMHCTLCLQTIATPRYGLRL